MPRFVDRRGDLAHLYRLLERQGGQLISLIGEACFLVACMLVSAHACHGVPGRVKYGQCKGRAFVRCVDPYLTG